MIYETDPMNIYGINNEDISIYSPKRNTPIEFLDEESLIKRLDRWDKELIEDIGSNNYKNLIKNHINKTNLTLRETLRIYDDGEEIYESLKDKLMIVDLAKMNDTMSRGPLYIGSFLSYSGNPSNEDKSVRLSKLINDPRHWRRNLEANEGLHVLRTEEVSNLALLVEDMLRNGGYPSETKTFLGRNKYLSDSDSIVKLLSSGSFSQGKHYWERPKQRTLQDKNGLLYVESEQGRPLLTISRYNRPSKDQVNESREIYEQTLSDLINSYGSKITKLPELKKHELIQVSAVRNLKNN